MKAKVGPLSIMKPLNDRESGILEYFELGGAATSVDPRKSELFQSGIQATIEEFSKIRGIRLRSRRNVSLNMKLSTNSGAPFFKKRKRVVEATLAGRANQYAPVAVLG